MVMIERSFFTEKKTHTPDVEAYNTLTASKSDVLDRIQDYI